MTDPTLILQRLITAMQILTDHKKEDDVKQTLKKAGKALGK